jgi:hypothetical protein
LAFFVFFGIIFLTAFFAFLARDFAALTTRFLTDVFFDFLAGGNYILAWPGAAAPERLKAFVRDGTVGSRNQHPYYSGTGGARCRSGGNMAEGPEQGRP